MGLLNGGIECIAAADLRGPPPDAGRGGLFPLTRRLILS